VTDTAELTSRLLESDPNEREALLRAVEPGALGAAIQALGHRREPAAAEVLTQIDDIVDDRALRKEARRELHRLRSMGVEPPAPVGRPAPPTESRPKALDVSEALATDFDPSGARALWLIADRPLGGIWFAALLLNDQQGLQDLNLADTTRKRFQRDFEAMQRGAGVWVNLPGPYALQLVREAVDLSREVGSGLPSRYQLFRDQFGEAAGPPERALVYETISPVEINFNPGWVDESPRLLGEPEVAGWYVQVPADLRARALEVARTPSTGLLVPGHTPEEQALQLVADAAHQAFTPSVRRALRRRLEETGYIFLQTDRLPMARLAAGAARALEDGGVAPERHPLMRLLLAAGLARLTGVEMVGSHRASEVLLELVERASQQQQGQGQGAVETRPSGLILPR
jgi:hypothetical protein